LREKYLSMRNTALRLLVVLVGLGASLGTTAARADDEANRKRRDHDVARKALTTGEIRPLEDVIAEVRRTVAGDIVGVELEQHDGRWTYEIKVITPPGRMRKVKVDASRTPAAPVPSAGSLTQPAQSTPAPVSVAPAQASQPPAAPLPGAKQP
jgi:hypothetical protein